MMTIKTTNFIFTIQPSTSSSFIFIEYIVHNMHIIMLDNTIRSRVPCRNLTTKHEHTYKLPHRLTKTSQHCTAFTFNHIFTVLSSHPQRPHTALDTTHILTSYQYFPSILHTMLSISTSYTMTTDCISNKIRCCYTFIYLSRL